MYICTDVLKPGTYKGHRWFIWNTKSHGVLWTNSPNHLMLALPFPIFFFPYKAK